MTPRFLTNRTMAQIAGDKGSAEWKSSRPASRGKVKAAWLADAIARADKKRKSLTTEGTDDTEEKAKKEERKTKKTKKSSVPPRGKGLARRGAEAHARGDPPDAGDLRRQGFRQSGLAV